MNSMRPLASRFLLAFDAGSVSGAEVTRGLGRSQLRGFASAPLAPGALVPSPFDRNLLRAEEVRAALDRVLQGLGGKVRCACLLLPDGVGRLALIDHPANASAVEYARFRLVQSLPYPATEAVTDLLPLGRGRSAAAAVRRSVAAEYEALAASAGLTPERLDLTPLAALEALLRQAVGPARTVDLILGDVACCLAGYHGGRLRVLRQRRRDLGPGEEERLRDEVQRTAALAGNGTELRLRVVGAGGRSLRTWLRSAGMVADGGWQLPGSALAPEAGEAAWLGEALA